MPNFTKIFFLLILSIILIKLLSPPKKKRVKETTSIQTPEPTPEPKRVYIPKYRYRKKPFLVTKGENEFYHVLHRIIKNQYLIFPQIHLISLLEHQLRGQGWRGAKAYIDRLSVDYVICDKKHLMPILAIELDDSTHNREERIERDMKVESILKQAGIPLVRVPYIDRFKEEKIKEKVFQYLKSNESEKTPTSPSLH